jgi:hypothetical protein
MLKRLVVKTEYVAWYNESTSMVSYEMYPNLVFKTDSITFTGNVPSELGKIYCEIDCNDLVATAMALDPRLIIESVIDLEEPEVVV